MFWKEGWCHTLTHPPIDCRRSKLQTAKLQLFSLKKDSFWMFRFRTEGECSNVFVWYIDRPGLLWQLLITDFRISVKVPPLVVFGCLVMNLAPPQLTTDSNHTESVFRHVSWRWFLLAHFRKVPHAHHSIISTGLLLFVYFCTMTFMTRSTGDGGDVCCWLYGCPGFWSANNHNRVTLKCPEPPPGKQDCCYATSVAASASLLASPGIKSESYLKLA